MAEQKQDLLRTGNFEPVAWDEPEIKAEDLLARFNLVYGSEGSIIVKGKALQKDDVLHEGDEYIILPAIKGG